jgi:hypothetical protein
VACGVAAASRMGVREDQAAHQLRAVGGEQERGLATEGLTDGHHRTDANVIDSEGGVGHVGGAR